MFAYFFILFLIPFSLCAQPQMLWNTPYGGTGTIWSPDGKQVASIGDGGISIVDVESSANRRDLNVYAFQPAFNAAGTGIITVTDPGVVALYDTKTTELVSSVKYQDTTIKSLVLSRDRGRACAWYNNNVVVVLDVATLDSLMSVSIPGLQHVAISGDGSKIACTFSGLEGTNVSIYTVGERVPRMSVGFGERMAALNETGDQIVTASENGLLTLWDVKTGNKLKQEYWIAVDGNLRELMLAPFDVHVIVVGDDIGVFATNDLSFKGRVRQKSQQPIQFSAEGAYLLSFKSGEGMLLYSLEAYKIVSTPDPYSELTIGASISPDGWSIALTHQDNTIRVLDREFQSSTVVMTGIGPSILGIRPGVDRIVTRVGRDIVTTDIVSGKEIGRYEQWPRLQEFNVTDTEVWTVNDDTIEIRSIPNGELVHRQILSPGFHTVPVSFPDETHILGLFADTTMRKVNIRNGETVWSAPREKTVEPPSYAIAPSGAHIAVMLSDQVSIYDATSGVYKRTFDLPNGTYVSGVVFHPDDQRLLAGSFGTNSGLRIWNVNTGDSLFVLKSDARSIHNPTLYPNGRHVVTSSGDSTLTLWDIDSGELVKRVKGPNGIFGQGVKIDQNGDLLAINFFYSTELWNASTLSPITTLPRWNIRSFDATGSKLIMTRGTSNKMMNYGVGSLGVIDILPYVITSTPDQDPAPENTQHQLHIQPNPVTSTTTIRVRFSSSEYQNIQISDLTGRPILSLIGSGTLEPQEFTIERAQLPAAGTYYLKATDSTSSITTSLLLAL